MRNTLITIAAAAVIVTSSADIARADEIDKKTTITVKENLLIPGRILPPGKYVMKLANVTANRHVVQIFNEDQNKLEATIMAFNNYRLDPTSKTVLQFWETPAGSPPALRAWFFPGDNYGQEFAYPREMAELLARENNNAKVPSYEATATTPSTEQLAQLEVRNVDPNPEPAQDTQVTPSPAPQQVAQIPASPPAPVVTPVEAPAPVRDNIILAQNNSPRPVTTLAEDLPSELPRTASTTPWIMVLGLLAMASAVGLRTMNKV